MNARSGREPVDPATAPEGRGSRGDSSFTERSNHGDPIGLWRSSEANYLGVLAVIGAGIGAAVLALVIVAKMSLVIPLVVGTMAISGGMRGRDAAAMGKATNRRAATIGCWGGILLIASVAVAWLLRVMDVLPDGYSRF